MSKTDTALTSRGEEVRTDFDRPETMVEVLIDGEWSPTPFQASNFYTGGCPDAARMARTVDEWLTDQTPGGDDDDE